MARRLEFDQQNFLNETTDMMQRNGMHYRYNMHQEHGARYLESMAGRPARELGTSPQNLRNEADGRRLSITSSEPFAFKAVAAATGAVMLTACRVQVPGLLVTPYSDAMIGLKSASNNTHPDQIFEPFSEKDVSFSIHRLLGQLKLGIPSGNPRTCDLLFGFPDPNVKFLS